MMGGFEEVGQGNGGMNKILFYYTQYKVLKNKEKIFKIKTGPLPQAASKYRNFHPLGSQAAGSQRQSPASKSQTKVIALGSPAPATEGTPEGLCFTTELEISRQATMYKSETDMKIGQEENHASFWR